MRYAAKISPYVIAIGLVLAGLFVSGDPLRWTLAALGVVIAIGGFAVSALLTERRLQRELEATRDLLAELAERQREIMDKAEELGSKPAVSGQNIIDSLKAMAQLYTEYKGPEREDGMQSGK